MHQISEGGHSGLSADIKENKVTALLIVWIITDDEQWAKSIYRCVTAEKQNKTVAQTFSQQYCIVAKQIISIA